MQVKPLILDIVVSAADLVERKIRFEKAEFMKHKTREKAMEFLVLELVDETVEGIEKAKAKVLPLETERVAVLKG